MDSYLACHFLEPNFIVNHPTVIPRLVQLGQLRMAPGKMRLRWFDLDVQVLVLQGILSREGLLIAGE
jgi:hypothetical protein